jgi:hypothetical protein
MAEVNAWFTNIIQQVMWVNLTISEFSVVLAKMNASIPDRALASLQATPETNAAFIAITGNLRCILRQICRPTAWLVRLCSRHWWPVMRV